MAVTITHLTITDDHTSRTAAEVMACLQLDQGSPEEKQKCDRLLRDLDFPSEHQNEEEYSQFVFNGQCLILGDSRVGKTSLVNALIKKPFDSEEPSTLGVRTNSVDQEWQNANLAFGSFARFGKSVRSLRAFISSEEYLAFEEGTSTLSLCMIWSLYLFGAIMGVSVSNNSFDCVSNCIFLRSLYVFMSYSLHFGPHGCSFSERFFQRDPLLLCRVTVYWT